MNLSAGSPPGCLVIDAIEGEYAAAPVQHHHVAGHRHVPDTRLHTRREDSVEHVRAGGRERKATPVTVANPALLDQQRPREAKVRAVAAEALRAEVIGNATGADSAQPPVECRVDSRRFAQHDLEAVSEQRPAPELAPMGSGLQDLNRRRFD